MGRILLFLSAALIFFAGADAQSPVKKYDIKSGIITFETNMKMGSMEMKEKSIVYFDDYGMKECKETYSNDNLKTSFFSDGKNLYRLNHSNKTAVNKGKAYRGTEMRVDWSEFGSEKDKQVGKIKQGPPMTIAGKRCEVIDTDEGNGTIARYAGWKKILLYLDVRTKTIRTTTSAVKVEENAKVPASKFEVPAGYKMTPG